ncbi:hypothetical protein J4E08_00310 [Sagittula sp. NFXS13]
MATNRYSVVSGGCADKTSTNVFAQTVPAVPRIYRFSYAVGVCGLTLKAWSHENFGAAIMSATAFEVSAERAQNSQRPPGRRGNVRQMNAAQYLVGVRGRGIVCARQRPSRCTLPHNRQCSAR